MKSKKAIRESTAPVQSNNDTNYLIDNNGTKYEFPKEDDQEVTKRAFLNIDETKEGTEDGEDIKAYCGLRQNPERGLEIILEAELLVALKRSRQMYRNSRDYKTISSTEEIYLKYTDKFQCRALQIAETIMKIRGKGDQKIVVEKLNMSGQSQAIIGDVSNDKGQ
jgi:hypothetical protein